MKITKKILQKRAKQTLESVLYLDLSGLGIGAIEGLKNCGNLQILDLSFNNIEEIEGINCCQHLWNVNFSHNQICSLTELSHFYAFGTVDLSYNNLSWKDLLQIQDIIILDLRLHGNQILENDSYYRIHVIDCLPNIWMLDGRIITSAERQQVQHFFHDSALSSRPVRRKLSDRPHTCITRQRIHANNIFGVRTPSLMSKFPRNEIQSTDTDLRRLTFLCENVQNDITVQQLSDHSELKYVLPNSCLQKMIDHRQKDRERCNMLLLLLVSSLQFNIPSNLLDETLIIAKLNPYARIETSQLFSLDRRWRIQLVSLLLSASKLDRDMKLEGSGGLYDRLYLCLYYLVSDLVRLDWKKQFKRKSSMTDKSQKRHIYISSYHRPQTAPLPSMRDTSHAKRLDQSREENRLLLASEIVLLLSVVPSFYKYVESDPNLRDLLEIATNNIDVTNRIILIAKETRDQGGDMHRLYKEISECIINQIEHAALSIRHTPLQHTLFSPQKSNYMPTNETRSEWKIILNTRNAYPRRPKSAVLTSGEHLTTGRRRTYADMQSGTSSSSGLQPSVRSLSNGQKVSLGSNILLGPQNMARVIAMPESHIALVQMNSIPAANGSIIVQSKNEEDHYCYVDITHLELDSHLGCWKPYGTVGDKVTLQATDSKRNIANLSRTPDALIFDKEYNKQDGGRSRQLSGKSSPAKQEVGSQSISGNDDEYNTIEIPPRPLSALFKEKMNLRLPDQSSVVWTDTDSHVAKENLLTVTPMPQIVTPDVSKELINVSDLGDGDVALEGQPSSGEMSTNLNIIENETENLLNAAEDTIKLQMVEDTPIENTVEQTENREVDEKHSEIEINIENTEINSDENEPEIQALMDPIPKQPGTRRNRTAELRRRAISARQPKHAKVADSSRPLSAVIRPRDLLGNSMKQMYRDDFGMERPDSASSFQFERTEAWRSSTSSNIGIETKSPRLQAMGFMSVPHNRVKSASFQVIPLRPTPPQRPSSPSVNSSSTKRKKQETQMTATSIKGSPIIKNSEKDKGIKLASEWLADGKDLHEEYKKSRVYMTPHIPGYLDGIINQTPAQKRIISSSLPLTSSLIMKLEKMSSGHSHSCKRSTPAPISLKEYLPPGIGIPQPSNKAKFSTLGEVKQLFGRYPSIPTRKSQEK
ncbi:uncharacterized protein LOC120339887 [Styela clava]